MREQRMKVLGGEAEIEVEADLDVKDDGGLIAPAWDLTGYKLRGTCIKSCAGQSRRWLIKETLSLAS